MKNTTPESYKNQIGCFFLEEFEKNVIGKCASKLWNVLHEIGFKHGLVDYELSEGVANVYINSNKTLKYNILDGSVTGYVNE